MRSVAVFFVAILALQCSKAVTAQTQACGSTIAGAPTWSVIGTYATPNTDAAAAPGGNAVTVGFTLQTAYTAASTANAITISFPTGYFVPAAAGGVPQVACTGGATAPTATVTALGAGVSANQFVLSLTNAWDTTAKLCTFSNIKSGVAIVNSGTCGANGVRVTTTFDLTSPAVAATPLGAQALISSWTVNAAYLLPGVAASDVNPDGNAVVVVFTTSAIPGAGTADAITINFPSGFFVAAGTVPSVACTGGAIAPTASVAALGSPATRFVLTTTNAWTAVEKTCTFRNIGSSTKAKVSTVGVSVESKLDVVSRSIASGPIGGQALISSWTVTPAYLIPNTAASNVDPAGNAVVVVFTTSAIPGAGTADAIIINFPSGFFVAAGTVPSVACTGGAIAPTASVAAIGSPATRFVLTTTNAWTAVEKTCTFRNIASPVKTLSTIAVTVESKLDFISRSIASGMIGIQALNPSWTVTPAYRAPNAAPSNVDPAGNAVVVVFTTSAIPGAGTADAITINFPSGFFVAAGTVPSVACTGGAIAPTASVAALGSPATRFVLTTTNAWTAVEKTCTFRNIGSGIKTGGAVAVSVESQLDHVSTMRASGPLGGQVSAVTMTVAQTLPNMVSAVTLVFTTASLLQVGRVITVNYPATYFSSTSSVTVTSVACSPACSTTTLTSPSFISGVGTMSVATLDIPAGTVTIILGAFTTALLPIVAPCSAVSVETTSDIESAVGNAPFSVNLGMRVQGVTFSMTPAQRVANVAAVATNAIVTVGFQLQSAYNVAAGTSNAITINFPPDFFLTSTPTVVCTGGATAPAATVVFAGTTQFVLTTTNAWDTTAKVCTFSNVATGGPTNGAIVTVQSTLDRASVAVLSGSMGGQVQGVTFSMTPAQRVANVAAVAATAIVTVGFQLPTAYAAGVTNAITINYPNGFFLTSTPTVVCTGGTTAPTATVAWNAGNFVLTTTNAWDASAKVCTFSNVATGAPTGGNSDVSCGGGVTVVSTRDRTSAAVLSGSMGGQVQGVTFSMTPAQRVANVAAVAATAIVTVGFQLQSAYAAGVTNAITIMYPVSFFLSSIPTVVCTGGATAPAASVAWNAGNFVLTTTNAWDASAKVCTFSNVATGAPTDGAISVTVQSTLDRASVPVPSLTLGGVVTGVSMTILNSNRVAQANRQLTVAFTTFSDLIAGSTITIGYPNAFLATSPTPIVTMAIATGTTAGVPGPTSIVLSTLTATLTAGSVVTITLCGVTMGDGAGSGAVTNGVTVQTNRDRIACNTVAPNPVTNQVTAVSLTIAAAQRIAGVTGVVTVSFKTATTLDACANRIEITVPANFFVADPSPATSAVVASSLGAGYTVSVATGSITLTGTTAVAPGVQGVTISGITFGAATNGEDTGVTVRTMSTTNVVDIASDGAPSGDLSGFMVKSVRSNGCGQLCSTLTIVFSSLARANLGNAITITFPGTTTITGTPDKLNMGGLVQNGQQVLVTPSVVGGNTIVLTPSAFNINFPAFDGSDVTIVLSGAFSFSSTLNAHLATRVSMRNVATGTGTRTNEVIFTPIGMGTTTTTRLAITRPFPGVTNTQVTIGFKTTSPILNSHNVRIFFPTGFLIPTAAVTTCSATTLNYFMTASLVGSSCNALNPRGILGPNDNPIRVVTGTTTSYLDVRFDTGSADAGAQSIVLNGVTLSATAMPTSTAFYVVTTADTCSAGMIATGGISNPAPGAPGSTGASVLLSTTVAIVCSLLFWL